MKTKNYLPYLICGALAGSVTGLLGTGGGMILVPALTLLTPTEEKALFPSSVAVIAPIGLVALFMSPGPLPFRDALPYLLGSCAGGIAAGLLSSRIPTAWLHRILGIMILWGGVRQLC